VELKGPDFSKLIYCFWDGGRIFKERIVALKPGKWFWQNFSNCSDDNGLKNKIIQLNPHLQDSFLLHNIH
jgi:hypothetical protein